MGKSEELKPTSREEAERYARCLVDEFCRWQSERSDQPSPEESYESLCLRTKCAVDSEDGGFFWHYHLRRDGCLLAYLKIVLVQGRLLVDEIDRADDGGLVQGIQSPDPERFLDILQAAVARFNREGAGGEG